MRQQPPKSLSIILTPKNKKIKKIIFQTNDAKYEKMLRNKVVGLKKI